MLTLQTPSSSLLQLPYPFASLHAQALHAQAFACRLRVKDVMLVRPCLVVSAAAAHDEVNGEPQQGDGSWFQSGRGICLPSSLKRTDVGMKNWQTTGRRVDM